MKCSECGYENKDTAKFCTKCGSALAEKPEPVSQASSNSNQKIIQCRQLELKFFS